MATKSEADISLFSNITIGAFSSKSSYLHVSLEERRETERSGVSDGGMNTTKQQRFSENKVELCK